MGTNPSRAQLDHYVSLLREKQGNPMTREEITEIVESILSSLQGDMSIGDIKMYHELEALAGYIQKAKDEIAALRPEDINQEHIPLASDELDAIVAATEDATGSILDAAEQLEEVAKGVDEEKAKAIEEAVTNIYEACNFQDITGQRITKVVKALKHIEERIHDMVIALGDENQRAEAEAARAQQDDRDEDSKLLNGPQLPENANSQAEIDALFGD